MVVHPGPCHQASAAPEGRRFAIDPAKVEADAQFDGIFVLRTNMKLSALAVVLRYRNLLAVEQSFLASKALFATRPVFHRTDAAIRGHIFCTFLALVLRKELLDRLAARSTALPEWQHIVDDLADLSTVEVDQDGRRALLRTAPRRFCASGRCPISKCLAQRLCRRSSMGLAPTQHRLLPPFDCRSCGKTPLAKALRR